MSATGTKPRPVEVELSVKMVVRLIRHTYEETVATRCWIKFNDSYLTSTSLIISDSQVASDLHFADTAITASSQFTPTQELVFIYLVKQ